MSSYTFRDQDVRIVDRDLVGYSSFYGRNLVTDVAESSILTEVNSQRIRERRMGSFSYWQKEKGDRGIPRSDAEDWI
jgi:hypothetical protein